MQNKQKYTFKKKILSGITEQALIKPESVVPYPKQLSPLDDFLSYKHKI